MVKPVENMSPTLFLLSMAVVVIALGEAASIVPLESREFPNAESAEVVEAIKRFFFPRSVSAESDHALYGAIKKLDNGWWGYN